jgi:hypothetical protein
MRSVSATLGSGGLLRALAEPLQTPALVPYLEIVGTGADTFARHNGQAEEDRHDRNRTSQQ